MKRVGISIAEVLEARRLLASTVSVSAVEVAEGAGEAVFNVTLDTPVTQTTTLRFQTQAGSAKSGQDFVRKAGRLTFTPDGPTSQQVRVPIKNDAVFEGGEQFALKVSGGKTLGQAAATASISDDEVAPTIQVLDAVVAEPKRGRKLLTMAVTLSHPSSQPISVSYATQDGTATAGNDYRAATGFVTIKPGQTGKTFKVTILPRPKGETSDGPTEGDENFAIAYSDGAGGTLAADKSIVTIVKEQVRTSYMLPAAAVAEATPTPAATVGVNLNPNGTIHSVNWVGSNLTSLHQLETATLQTARPDPYIPTVYQADRAELYRANVNQYERLAIASWQNNGVTNIGNLLWGNTSASRTSSSIYANASYTSRYMGFMDSDWTTWVTDPSINTSLFAIGDANLDGKLDAADRQRWQNGHANRLKGWGNGDFNLDGVVDTDDLTLLDLTQARNIPASSYYYGNSQYFRTLDLSRRGDADLDGDIDDADLAILTAGMAGKLAGWGNGDFNRDGAIDADDLSVFDLARSRMV